MELLDRYLYEVRRYLPAAQQDDIIAEISDALQSHVEDRERALGRPLTDAEAATIVRAFGHPKIVASRYQPAQYLIGPEIYPFYWYTLKLALAGVLALELLGAMIAALLSPSPMPTFIKNIAVMWPTIFLMLGVVTFIFVALERSGSGSSVLTKLGIDKWNPRALPRATHGEVPRFSLLVEAAANIIFMLWLLDFSAAAARGRICDKRIGRRPGPRADRINAGLAPAFAAGFRSGRSDRGARLRAAAVSVTHKTSSRNAPDRECVNGDRRVPRPAIAFPRRSSAAGHPGLCTCGAGAQ